MKYLLYTILFIFGILFTSCSNNTTDSEDHNEDIQEETLSESELKVIEEIEETSAKILEEAKSTEEEINKLLEDI